MDKFLNQAKAMLACFLLCLGGIAGPLAAQVAQPQAISADQPTFADLADLADSAKLVVRVKVDRQAEVEPERAIGLQPGFARLYIEAETVSLLAGSAPLGESLRYLVDVPRDERGRAPKLKRQEFLVFATPVAGRPGELQLVDPQAQIAWSPQLEQRVRPILAGLYAADAVPAVAGVRDALSVAGNLAGESETQIFLLTRDDSPLAITVARRPGMIPVWGYSQTEIVDQSARAPQPGTIAWYRLACFLPASLPPGTNLSTDAQSQQQAVTDYAFVVAELGPCPRNRS